MTPSFMPLGVEILTPPLAADLPRLNIDARLAPITFAWFARTVTGRASRYLQTWTTHRLRCVGLVLAEGQRLPLYVPSEQSFHATAASLYARLRTRSPHAPPRVPKGYTWHGPALAQDVPPPAAPGRWHDGLFALRWDPADLLVPSCSHPALSAGQALAARVLATAAGGSSFQRTSST